MLTIVNNLTAQISPTLQMNGVYIFYDHKRSHFFTNTFLVFTSLECWPYMYLY